MSKVTIELNSRQIREAVEGLSNEEKLRLTERLEKETIGLRWKQILNNIDSRLRKFPISKREVIKEIQAYRKEKYA
jgi:hypothetical protein